MSVTTIRRNLLEVPQGGTPYDVVDRLPAAYRALVHEFGMSMVNDFVIAGVGDPKTIRRLIAVVRRGAREINNKRPPNIATAPALNALDVVLTQMGAGIPGRAVAGALRDLDYLILPISPTKVMIAASMATVANHDVRVTKEGKHERRLQAALRAADREMWEGRPS